MADRFLKRSDEVRIQGSVAEYPKTVAMFSEAVGFKVYNINRMCIPNCIVLSKKEMIKMFLVVAPAEFDIVTTACGRFMSPCGILLAM